MTGQKNSTQTNRCGLAEGYWLGLEDSFWLDLVDELLLGVSEAGLS
jgi:hypothetical protein